MKLNLKHLALLFVGMLCAACGGKESDGPESDGSPFVIFAEREIATDFSGVQRRVEAVSNCDWNVSDAPEWCAARKVVEGEKEYLEVEVRPSDEEVPRRGVILISGGDVGFRMPVAQGGRGSADALQWYTFPVNFFSSIKSQLQPDKVGRLYQITAQRMCVGPSVVKRAFVGNVLNRLADNAELIDFYDQCTFYPITISSSRGAVKELSKPSFEGMDELVRQVIAEMPEESLDFYTYAPVQYNSYRHLHLLGVGNMGINLDVLAAGKPYAEQEMEKKTGMLYNYSYELFSVVMDDPEDGELVENTFDENIISYMCYINRVVFGKTALLLVESDYGFGEVKEVVALLFDNQQLNSEEELIGKSLDVCYVYFDKEGAHAVKGGRELIKRYVDEMKAGSVGIVPLSFTTSKLKDNSAGTMEIGFELP